MGSAGGSWIGVGCGSSGGTSGVSAGSSCSLSSPVGSSSGSPLGVTERSLPWAELSNAVPEVCGRFLMFCIGIRTAQTGHPGKDVRAERRIGAIPYTQTTHRGGIGEAGPPTYERVPARAHEGATIASCPPVLFSV
jgi:hypothetical protein